MVVLLKQILKLFISILYTSPWHNRGKDEVFIFTSSCGLEPVFVVPNMALWAFTARTSLTIARSSLIEKGECRPPRTQTKPSEGLLDVGGGDLALSRTGDEGMTSAMFWWGGRGMVDGDEGGEVPGMVWFGGISFPRRLSRVFTKNPSSVIIYIAK